MNKTLFGDTCICLARVSKKSQNYQAQLNVLHIKAMELGLSVKYDIIVIGKDALHDIESLSNTDNCHIILCTDLQRLASKVSTMEKIKSLLIEKKIQLITLAPEMELFNDYGEVKPSSVITISIAACMIEHETKARVRSMKWGHPKK